MGWTIEHGGRLISLSGPDRVRKTEIDRMCGRERWPMGVGCIFIMIVFGIKLLFLLIEYFSNESDIVDQSFI